MSAAVTLIWNLFWCLWFQAGKVIDSVWIKKDHHDPYPEREWHPLNKDKLQLRLKKKGYQMFSVSDGDL